MMEAAFSSRRSLYRNQRTPTTVSQSTLLSSFSQRLSHLFRLLLVGRGTVRNDCCYSWLAAVAAVYWRSEIMVPVAVCLEVLAVVLKLVLSACRWLSWWKRYSRKLKDWRCCCWGSVNGSCNVVAYWQPGVGEPGFCAHFRSSGKA